MWVEGEMLPLQYGQYLLAWHTEGLISIVMTCLFLLQHILWLTLHQQHCGFAPRVNTIHSPCHMGNAMWVYFLLS